MTKKSAQPNQTKTPKFRFPGFEGVWEEKRLGQVTSFLKGKGVSKDDISENGVNKCIRYGELYTDYREIIKDIKSKTNVSKNDSLESEENDAIIPSSGETSLDIATVSCVKESGVLLGGDLNVLRLNGQDGEFFAYYLSNFQNKNIARLAQGNSVVHLYASHLKDLRINLPKLHEQQKIASFLGGVDAWIENLQAQKKSLELYKKSLMQKIFSQHIRFKDEKGNDFMEWEEKRLGEVLKERNTQESKSEQYPLMSFVAYEGVSPKGDRYNREFLVNDEHNKKYKQTELGDFIYSSNNLETGSIGLNNYGSASISPVYSIFKMQDGYSSRFVGSYLTRKRFIAKMVRFRQGVVYGQWKIHETEFLKIKESFPSIQEQQKNAEFLSSVDRLLESKQQQITKAEEWKKGLMQGLFV